MNEYKIQETFYPFQHTLDLPEGTAAISISYENNEVQRVQKKSNYDLSNFVGEAGGSLGFFLGATVFTFYDAIEKLILDKLCVCGK